MRSVAALVIQGYYYAKPMHIDEFEEKYVKEMLDKKLKNQIIEMRG